MRFLRQHRITSYNVCYTKLLRAAKLLPYFDELPADDYGRAHKTACWAYAAKAHLYNAEYDATSYAKVVEYADKVITSGKHGLLDNYTDVFKVENNWT